MANIYDMSDVWADEATTFTAIKMDVTNTASSASSLLLDLQVGGASKFSVSKGGRVAAANGGSYLTPIFALLDETTTGWSQISTTNLGYIAGGVGVLHLGRSGATPRVFLKSDGLFGWGGAQINGSPDLTLARDAANTLAQRNGTNAQTFNLYNTYTSATIYERGFMKWNSNVLEIGTEAGSEGGTVRSISLLGSVNAGSITAGALSSNSTLTAGSNLNTASNRSAAIAGYAASATGNDSLAVGRLSAAYRNGMYAFGSGLSGAQSSLMNLHASTADATPTLLDTPFGSQQIAVPTGRAIWVEVTVLAKSSGGVDNAVFRRGALIQNVGGTTSLIGAVQTLGTDLGSNAGTPPSGWAFNILADDPTNTIQMQATGVEATTITWFARVDMVEM